MAKRCKNGLRRDGKCRRTKCRRKLTKGGYCPKGAGGGGTGRRRKTPKRRRAESGRATMNRYLRQLAEFKLGYRKEPPMIGTDARTRRNAGRGDPEKVAGLISRMRAA